MNDCAQCREWELCPFHPRESEKEPETARTGDERLKGFRLAPATKAEVDESCRRMVKTLAAMRRADDEQPTGPRLLGPDDPEVSDQLVYATPTGGVVYASAPEVTYTAIGGTGGGSGSTCATSTPGQGGSGACYDPSRFLIEWELTASR